MVKTRKPELIYIILVILLLLTSILSLCLGAEKINVFQAFSDIINSNKTFAGRIFLYVRVPRTFGAVLGGWGLGLSGAIIQSVLSNSLASPGTIGVNSGAGLGVAVCGALFPQLAIFIPFASLIGAFIGAITVITIGEHFNSSKIGLVLGGVAISSIFSACIDVVLTFVPDALNGYSDFRIGGLSGISMKDLFPAAPLIIAGFITAVIFHNELDILILGMEESRTLGLNSKGIRILFLVIASVLAGSAISFTGLIGFVGLIVPHIMREFVGEESKALMITSALGGAILLLGSDLLSRLIFAPFELPVGIIMALIGGPFFIHLLRKRGSVAGGSHD